MSQAPELTQPMLEDVQFVRRVAEPQRFGTPDLVVACVWAAVNLVGFSLYDLSVLAGGVFWMVALPLFGIGTGVWSARVQKRAGEINRDLGRRHSWHWTAIPLFLVLANGIFLGGEVDGTRVGQVVLLVVGLVYYLGGVHFWRGFWYGGLAMGSGVIWLGVLDAYAWTLTGVLTSLALMVPALLDWRNHAEIR